MGSPYTNLNIPRIGDKMLEGFVKELAALGAFSTRYEPSPAGRHQGNAILVPLVGSLSATTFNNSYAISGGTKSVVTVTIDKHKIVHIGQSDLDALNNSDARLDAFFFQAGAALGQAVVEDVLTLVTTANFVSVGTVVSSTDLSLSQLRAARLALSQSNVPKLARFGLIDAVGYDALLGISNFLQANLAGSTSALREGSVGRALGMDLWEMNSSFVSAASVNAFFGHASAIAVAMRYVAPQKPGEYDMAQSFTDAASGATFGLRSFYDPATGMDYMAIEANWGKSVGTTYGARIVKRAD